MSKIEKALTDLMAVIREALGGDVEIVIEKFQSEDYFRHLSDQVKKAEAEEDAVTRAASMAVIMAATAVGMSDYTADSFSVPVLRRPGDAGGDSGVTKADVVSSADLGTDSGEDSAAADGGNTYWPADLNEAQ